VLGVALLLLIIPLYQSQKERVSHREVVGDFARELAAQAAPDLVPVGRVRGGLPAELAAVRPQLGRIRSEAQQVAAALRVLDHGGPLPRVVVVDARDRLVADTYAAAAPSALRQFPRDEVLAALAGHDDRRQRRSEDLGAPVELTSVPARIGGSIVGGVRLTRAYAPIRRRLLGLTPTLLLVAAAFVVMTMGAAIMISRVLVRQIRALEATVRRLSAGDLSARAPVVGSREQRLIARALNEMAARVQQTLDNEGAFVANASHQLRTPLTGVRLRVELLRRRLAGDSRGEEHATRALFEIDRLSAIVDELLELSDLGERPHELVEVDLDASLRDAAERWSPVAAARRIDLHGEPWPEPCPALAIPEDLARALDVLIENALQYSPEGSTVVIAARPGVLEVVDQGPGLEPGEEERLFERFARGRAARGTTKGSGLGLAIARDLMHRCGGTACIANAPGGGARAWLELPTHRNGATLRSLALHSTETWPERP
jgi:signal transduction histidine kinase